MNLIITCARHMEEETQDELAGFLEELGDAEPRITITGMSGILTADTCLDPVDAVRRIKEKLLDEPWTVRYCLRIIPIQAEVRADAAEIADAASRLASGIKENESYRISIEKRDSDISGQELIKSIAGGMKNRVSLEHPDKVILVEILAGAAGVSVLEKSDILSVEKARRSMSE